MLDAIVAPGKLSLVGWKVSLSSSAATGAGMLGSTDSEGTVD